MKSIDQQVILVTGATDGLGFGVAEKLASLGATVLLHGRSAEKLANAKSLIEKRTGNTKLKTYQADFASLQQIRDLASDILKSESSLDVLINNAGIGVESTRRESDDGIELTFQVDYLSTYMLSNLLLPLLKRSAPSRIVNVASAGQAPIDFSNPLLIRDWSGVQAYCQAKLAQINFTFRMAKDLENTGVTVNAFHPASYMPTKIVKGLFSVQSSIEEGVDATLNLAVSRELKTTSGRYFNGMSEEQPNSQASNIAMQRALKELSEQLTGI